MLRAEFNEKNSCRALKFGGRLISNWAVAVKSLVSPHLMPNGLLVDISEVRYVDSVGEQLLLWLGGLQATFVADAWYARDVCERLHLTVRGNTHRPIRHATDIS